jgi:hypothetical protein
VRPVAPPRTGTPGSGRAASHGAPDAPTLGARGRGWGKAGSRTLGTRPAAGDGLAGGPGRRGERATDRKTPPVPRPFTSAPEAVKRAGNARDALPDPALQQSGHLLAIYRPNPVSRRLFGVCGHTSCRSPSTKNQGRTLSASRAATGGRRPPAGTSVLPGLHSSWRH